ncbi:MAG: hypothetical protein K2P35_12725, partial [Lachnospiraceae bacterium]|nr:hypothetical protein [Lachnospiraceae bacterium]
LTTRGAFGDWRIWSPNAPHILTYMSMVFENLTKMFSGIWRKAKKQNMKKERKFGLKEFPRPLNIVVWRTNSWILYVHRRDM